MKCATSGCSHLASRECVECERKFCDSHVEQCDLCEEYVCFECRDVHQSNPLHGEGERAS